jgi:hypothetical protein
MRLQLSIYISCDVLGEDENVVVGQGINGGSAELEGGATVQFYSM